MKRTPKSTYFSSSVSFVVQHSSHKEELSTNYTLTLTCDLSGTQLVGTLANVVANFSEFSQGPVVGQPITIKQVLNGVEYDLPDKSNGTMPINTDASGNATANTKQIGLDIFLAHQFGSPVTLKASTSDPSGNGATYQATITGPTIQDITLCHATGAATWVNSYNAAVGGPGTSSFTGLLPGSAANNPAYIETNGVYQSLLQMTNAYPPDPCNLQYTLFSGATVKWVKSDSQLYVPTGTYTLSSFTGTSGSSAGPPPSTITVT